MKKLLALVLVAASLVLLVACGTVTPTPTEPAETTAPIATSGSLETTGTTPAETTGNTPAETTGSSATETTGQIVDPPEAPHETGRKWVSVGSYVTLCYNATTCEVETSVKKGLGSRETVTLTVKMRDGYLFDGWTVKDPLAKNPTMSKDTGKTFTLEASEATKVHLNTSMTLVYDENGGVRKAGFDGKQTFSLTSFEFPNTLIDDDYFTREGYTLTGFNTKADGTGDFVTLGGKLQNQNSSVTLYCVWEENSLASDFEVEGSGSTVTVKSYKGERKNVVIPEYFGKKKVTAIAANAFANSDITRVVVPKSVSLIEENAFANCKSLTSVVLSDASFGTSGSWMKMTYGVSTKSFAGCDALSDVCINTVNTLTAEWMTSTGAQKLDRLMWAKDKKKIIIIGGSGSWLGYNGNVLSEELDGEYEIINLGENANVNATMYFDIVEHFVKEGDIVLWSPEPGTYTLGSRKSGGRTYWDFRKSDYQFMRYLTYSNYDDLFETFSTYAARIKTVNKKPFDAADGGGMDPYGCDMGTRVWNKTVFADYRFSYPLSAQKEMKAIFDNITGAGAKIYFSFAAMQKSGLEASKVSEKDILAYEKMLTDAFPMVSISDYKNLILADELFYDSAWHLSNEGTVVRSKQVAKDIKAQLAKEGK